MTEPILYSFKVFYTPDQSLLSDECIDELYIIYDQFVNEYTNHFIEELTFDYFLSFAIFHDPAKETHYRHIPRNLIFKYRKFPPHPIDHNLIMQMYEQLIACSYNQFFTNITSESFMKFIAPFIREESLQQYDNSDDENDESVEYSVIIVPNSYDLHDSREP